MTFNVTVGIPLTSVGPKDSPNVDNATWFSTVGNPPYKAPEGFCWGFNETWKLVEAPKVPDATPDK